MWAKVERRLAKILFAKKIAMRNEVGVVSFCFDDVPQSACRVGREILERYGCQGTYYVCGGLTDRQSESRAFHTSDDLKSISEGGHELGCHGFAHLNYQAVSPEDMRNDVRRNQEFFEGIGCDMPPTTFAYPYGCVSPTAKRVCRDLFVSSRGAHGGLNHGVADLALLKATRLYRGLLSEEDIVKLIHQTESTKGWLIFLTHGVETDAGPFDCTPNLLEFAVRHVSQSSCRLLPVCHALGHVAFKPS